MDLPCKALGCTACCQWGNAVELLKPAQYLKADPVGNCEYLMNGGCALYGKPARPLECSSFDCRDLVAKMIRTNEPGIRMIMAAIKLQGYLAEKENAKH